MKTYKYYLYYVKKDNSLYAYTDNKEYRKRFKKFRNPEYFYEKKKTMTKQDINRLAYLNQGDILEKYFLETYDLENHQIIELPVIMTKNEYQSMANFTTQFFESDLFKLCWFDIDLFEESFAKDLKRLNYHLYSEIISSKKTGTETDAYKKLRKIVKPDYFRIFCKLYDYTLKDV